MYNNNNAEIVLKDVLVLIDREFGVSVFTNFRGYDNVVDDAEWLLERNMTSKGFVLRPIMKRGKLGLWIGEYANSNGEILRSEEVFDEEAKRIHRKLLRYSSKRSTERTFIEEFPIYTLKKMDSWIIRSFKYYICPPIYFYSECREIPRIYKMMREKYVDCNKILYSQLADDIFKVIKCENVVICPLKTPNALERLLNFNRAIRSRSLGEIIFLSPSFVKIL
ncbi:TPA: hypothetical protein EYP70_04210 [Candidatus Bathyarchaeota archaeon]|nr:hypothetical protein [Candidatus Bathyarchaeota archaeon]